MRFAPGYRTLSLLRRGGSVDVFDGWSDERGCRCVVKLLRKSREHSASARSRLRLEGRLLLSLSHPHIVRAYELIERPRMALILETLTGATLSHILRQSRRRLEAKDVALLGLHLGSALKYLHGKGFLHLDLKPSNIISQGGVLRLIDLGIARRPGRGVAGIGTDSYMAPEQARGGMLTPATDLFSLGAVLFEAATGQAAFRSDGERRRYDQLLRRADPVSQHRRLPVELSRTIDRCLDPDPARRPPLRSLMRDLDRVLRA